MDSTKNNSTYWIWLTSKRLIRPDKITSLIEKFGSVEEIYKEKNFYGIPNIGSRELAVLKDKSLDSAKNIEEKIHKLGGYIITFDSESYPRKLRNITTPPYILYCKGNFADFDEILTIGIVGTRHITDYGRIVTSRFAYDLARNGAYIVSGMARGADSIAARNALKANGRTAAVLGCGLDIVYPKENEGLMDEIIKNGVIITEYPPGTPPEGRNFPERNRIIAGLSNGVLVTDAPKESGSLITANIAMENGRDVFAVPRSILDKNSGTNLIIQQGAKLVIGWENIIEEYPYMSLEKTSGGYDDKYDDTEIGLDESAVKEEQTDDIRIKKECPKDNMNNIGDEGVASSLTGAERDIAEKLLLKNMQIDELASELDIPVSTLNTKLIMLEVKGAVKKLPGGFYRIQSPDE